MLTSFSNGSFAISLLPPDRSCIRLGLTNVMAQNDDVVRVTLLTMDASLIDMSDQLMIKSRSPLKLFGPIVPYATKRVTLGKEPAYKFLLLVLISPADDHRPRSGMIQHLERHPGPQRSSVLIESEQALMAVSFVHMFLRNSRCRARSRSTLLQLRCLLLAMRLLSKTGGPKD